MNTWRNSTIGEEVELAYGKSLPAHTRQAGPYEVFGSNGCVGNHTVPLVRGPGIIIGRKGSVGAIAYSHRDFWPIDTTYYVINKGEHHWRFLFYLLSSLGLERLNSHSTIPGLNREEAYSIAVSVPQLPEQRRIAQVLDAVQLSLKLAEQNLELAQDIKRETMRALFTRGLRGEAQKETEVGPIPESWTVTTLGELCDQSGGCIQTGPFGSQLHAHEYKSQGTPVINPTDLSGDRIEHANVPRVDEETTKRLERHAVKPGDILFGRRGEIGRHGLVSSAESGWLCGTGCFVVRVGHSGADSAFLSYLFSTEGTVAWLNAHAAGTIMPNLNNTVLRRLPVAYPAIGEQRDIVEVLDAINRKIDLHRRKRAVLDELFKTLLHKLMTGEIRVADLDLSAIEQNASAAA